MRVGAVDSRDRAGAPRSRPSYRSQAPALARFVQGVQRTAGNRAVGHLLGDRKRAIARVLKECRTEPEVKNLRELLVEWKKQVTGNSDRDVRWRAIAQGVDDKAERARRQIEKIANPEDVFLRTPAAERAAKVKGLRGYELNEGWMRAAGWAAAEGEAPTYLLVYSVRDKDVQLEDIVKNPTDMRPLGPDAHDELLKRARELGRSSVTLLADQEGLVTQYGKYAYVLDEIQAESKKRMTKTQLMSELTPKPELLAKT